MGQKVNPISFRLGSFYSAKSRWFADKRKYKDLLLEDVKIRRSLLAKLKPAGISEVEIERSINKLGVIVYVVRPGVVIGRGGTGLEDLKKFLAGLLQVKDKKNIPKIDLKVEPLKEPNLNAYLVAGNIAEQLEKRLPFKRILRQAADKVLSAGAKGIRIQLAGRIGGAEIARREKIQKGSIPLTTLREKIDFAKVSSLGKRGYVGVKVWIHKP